MCIRDRALEAVATTSAINTVTAEVEDKAKARAKAKLLEEARNEALGVTAAKKASEQRLVWLTGLAFGIVLIIAANGGGPFLLVAVVLLLILIGHLIWWGGFVALISYVFNISAGRAAGAALLYKMTGRRHS